MNKIERERIIVNKTLEVSKSKIVFDNLSIDGYYRNGFAGSIPMYKNDSLIDVSLDDFMEMYDLLIDDFQKYFSELHSNNNHYSLPEWNTVNFEIKSNGEYQSKYWYDEERVISEKLSIENDFPHAAATNLVNYHFFEIKFKRKFTRIHWTMEVKNGESFFDIYSINKKNQKLPVELQEIGVMFNVEDQKVYFEKFWKYSLLKHYEATNNGILKDVWKPWNKIVISIPPNGYLNENEDIMYYLDDVELEKDFFLRGY
jgi:hypothetical protein